MGMNRCPDVDADASLRINCLSIDLAMRHVFHILANTICTSTHRMNTRQSRSPMMWTQAVS